jgi:uncharacterized membrane protein
MDTIAQPNPEAAAISSVAAPSEAVSTGTQRLAAIDLLRGIAMLLMAIDHWAAFARINVTAEGYDGVRPALGSPLEVLVGLVTNLSSGIFFALAGTSIALFENSRRKRGWSEWQITRFLLIRAAILLVFDQVINMIGWSVRGVFLIEVLTAIAFSMIVLAFIRLLPLRVVAVLGAALFIGYPLLVSLFPHNPDQPLSIITTILVQNYREGFIQVETPLLARLSLMLGGYVMGRLLTNRTVQISPRWLWIAGGGLVAWLVLRLGLLQGYGDFLPYQAGGPWIDLLIDSKHPPSLTFLLFNMSISLALLVLLNSMSSWLANTRLSWVLTVLGQTALFFFIVHMLFYKTLEVILRGNPIVPVGDPVLRLLIETALTMVVLVPICAVYRNLRRKHAILSYL